MTAQQTIRGVVFDMDGTLYRQFPLRLVIGFLLVVSNLHRPSYLARTLKVVSAYRRAQETLRNRNEPIYQPAERQLELAADDSGEGRQFVASVVEMWFESIPLKFIGHFRRRNLPDLLDALVSAGIKVGVYSDYPVQSKLQSLGIAKYVSAALSAADDSVIGFKPKSNGYRLVSTLLGLHPEEILYVGDRPGIDGAGAVSAGMQTAIISGRQHRRDGHYRRIASLTQILDLVQDRAGPGRPNQ